MNIWIFGTGSVGGYYGGRLYQAGNRVLFIARGKQLEALRKNGLKIESKVEGDFLVPPSKIETGIDDDIVAHPDKYFHPDVVIVATKVYSNNHVIAVLRRYLQHKSKSATPLLCIFQNGMLSHHAYAQAFGGADHVCRGIVGTALSVSDPGVIHHQLKSNLIVGRDKKGLIAKMCKQLNDLKVPAFVSDDVEKELWNKILWNGMFNAVGALTGMTTMDIASHEEGKELLHSIGKEIQLLNKLSDTPLVITDELISTTIGSAVTFKIRHPSSTLQDVRKGARIEYEAVAGDLLNLAKAFHVDTPNLKVLYTLLKLLDHRIQSKL